MVRSRFAAVLCSPNAPRLGGVGLGSGSTGKLGRAWVGAWHGAWVYGCCDVVVVVMILTNKRVQ